MLHPRDTRFRVLAIGLSAAALILWLSGSFWLDAWHQSADVRRLERLVPLDRALRTLASDLADERTLTLGIVDIAAGGRFVLVENLSGGEAFDRLRSLRRRSDAAFDEIVLSLGEVLATPMLLEHLRMLPDGLTRALERIERQRRALVRDRVRFDGTFAEHDATATSPDAVRGVPAALRVYASSGHLVQELHALQSGIRLEPYKLMPEVEGLRRTRTGLRDFAEAESARAALQGLAPAYESRNVAGTPLARTLDRAEARARAVATRLASLAEERRIGDALRTELQSLIDDHARLLDSWFPIAPSINEAPRHRALALDGHVGRMIEAEMQATKAHGYRRLVIDSLLVASCFWFVIASLRLLGSIHHQAHHDRLTGLPNRAHLEEHLRRALGHERERGSEIALLMIDVDDFEGINDTFGHDVGDELLRRLAVRLKKRLDQPGLLAALGGDEFALVLWRVDAGSCALALAERLRGSCDEPFEVRGAALRVTLSVGMSVTGDHEQNEPGLMQRASIAMRQAKDAGKDRTHPFSRELAERSRARLELEADLRRAVDRGELELHYQPKADARSGRVHGAEALVRWRHPEHGLVSPARFVPLAERCGLIVPIGAWVLGEAVRRTAAWHRSGSTELQISVNVSAQQLVADDFLDTVDDALAGSGLAPEHLELEVTESVGMMDMKLVVARLERLRASGVRIAIDDFGTDYSSLQYLEDLPLDTLKIDRAFVTKLDRSEQGRSLVNTIVLMAKSFGLTTVAEGVETRVQLDKVIALGCDQVQGYYHSKPVAAEELPDVIARLDAAAPGDERRAA